MTIVARLPSAHAAQPATTPADTGATGSNHMFGRPRIVRSLAVSVVLAVVIAVVPILRIADVRAEDACTTTDEIKATTCRLVDGKAVEGSLPDADTSATYRVDALGQQGSLDLVLSAQGGSSYLGVLDWHGSLLAETTAGDSTSELHLHADLPLPGTYGVLVKGMPSAGSVSYRLGAKLAYPADPPKAFWPATLGSGESPLNGERQTLRTPRGGTPEGAVAVARSLGAPPEAVVDDFTLATDVQFDQIGGPVALSVRFRYEPEAGGGTGYVLEIDPYAGTATLESFDAGQRRPIASRVKLPLELSTDSPARLIVKANGPSISVSLDGQSVVVVSDERFARGLIVVGAVTWSDPVGVTFDHTQVTTPTK